MCDYLFVALGNAVLALLRLEAQVVQQPTDVVDLMRDAKAFAICRLVQNLVPHAIVGTPSINTSH